MNALEFVEAQYPWFAQLGIDAKQLQGWVASGLSGDQILNQVRGTDRLGLEVSGRVVRTGRCVQPKPSIRR